ERTGKIDPSDSGMRVRAEHQRRFQRPRHIGDVVEITCGAGDVANRAVVAHGGVHAAVNASERLVHNASTRSGTSEDVSHWKRRMRLAASRASTASTSARAAKLQVRPRTACSKFAARIARGAMPP